MSFTSYSFILFLCVLIPVYYIVPKKCRWVLLLGFSYFFYACGGISLLIYLVSVTLLIYIGTLMIDRVYEKKHRKAIMWAVIAVNLVLLGVVKYANLGISIINPIIAAAKGSEISMQEMILPMGISYYMFQALSYLIDVTRRTTEVEKNPFKVALFVGFFPQLVQGPISRYDKLSATLYEGGPLKVSNIVRGFERILWGYFKKLIVADRLMPAVTFITSDPKGHDGGYVFAAMVYYTIALYADFTGGIDVTIGIAQMLGIEVAENFDLPYFSQSLKEYWRRWHISMGTWFRDYLYYPMAVSKPIHRLSRWCNTHIGRALGRRVPVYLAGLVTWAATGLWHGAGFTFLLWGILNWIILMISEEFAPAVRRFHARSGFDTIPAYKVFRMVRTLAVVSLLRTLDIYSGVGETFKAVASMFTSSNWAALFTGGLLEIGLTWQDHLVVTAGILVMLAAGIYRYRGHSIREEINDLDYPVAFVIVLLLMISILVFGVYGMGYEASQFIYNRF